MKVARFAQGLTLALSTGLNSVGCNLFARSYYSNTVIEQIQFLYKE